MNCDWFIESWSVWVVKISCCVILILSILLVDLFSNIRVIMIKFNIGCISCYFFMIYWKSYWILWFVGLISY